MTIEDLPQDDQTPDQPEAPAKTTHSTIFAVAKGFNTAGDRLRVAMRTSESRKTAVKFLTERREQKNRG